jgi:hypothetical protein
MMHTDGVLYLQVLIYISDHPQAHFTTRMLALGQFSSLHQDSFSQLVYPCHHPGLYGRDQHGG